MSPIIPVYTLSPYFRSVLYSVTLSSKLRYFEIFLPACFLPTVVCYCLFSLACHVHYPYHKLSLISPWYLCGCVNVLRTVQVQWHGDIKHWILRRINVWNTHMICTSKLRQEFPLILNVHFYRISRMVCDCKANDINTEEWHSFSRKSSLLCWPPRPDRIWNPTGLIFGGYWKLFFKM